MIDIVAFITARLDEDELAALAAPGPQWDGGDGYLGVVDGQDLVWGNHTEGYIDAEASTHIARHDPARVLRDVEANRRLLDLHGQSEPDGHDGSGYRFACSHCDQTVPCASLRLLGAPYSDHPGWREEWRP